MTPIDFNKPVDRLDDVLFDVQLEKLFASPGSAKAENTEGKELPGYRLVCNRDTGKVISVVSKNYKLIFSSTFLISSEGDKSSASAILKRVDMVGCLNPRSSSEMYVLSRSHNSASFSCEIFFNSRCSLKTFPKILITMLLTLVRAKILYYHCIVHGL